MLKTEDRIFTNLDGLGPWQLYTARKRGIWSQIDEIIKSNSPDQIRELVKSAKIRGRGGAGFPAGTKWGFLPDNGEKRYLVINADESEPGTCQDREILRNEPHRLLEGILLAAYAIKANNCYVYIRGENLVGAQRLQDAIDECYDSGLLGKNACSTGWDLDVFVHRGAGAYVCGEESALIESLEGKKGMPRIKPPFPAVIGLYGQPTIVNNVETVAVIGEILRRGVKWWLDLGTENNHGTKVFSISGHINEPLNVEEELGITLRELLERYAGGVEGGWDNLMGVHPGGSSSPFVIADDCQDLAMDFDSVAAVGSMLGTASVIVARVGTDIVKMSERCAYMYMEESCGQCTTCREGTYLLWDILKRASEGTISQSDLNNIVSIDNTHATSICPLFEAAQMSVRTSIRGFKEKLEQRILNDIKDQQQRS